MQEADVLEERKEEGLLSCRKNGLSTEERDVLEIALQSGCLLLANGAETTRIEDTVGRILALADFEDIQVISVLSGIFVTVRPPQSEYLTVSKRTKIRQTNLQCIVQVNTISRALAAGEMSFKEGLAALEKLGQDGAKMREKLLASYFLAFGFTMLLGGNLQESLLAGCCDLATVPVASSVKGKKLGNFIPVFLESLILSLLALFFSRLFPGLNPDLMTAGAMMSHVPGTTLANFFRDIMHGDYLTGIGNLLSALVTALALALGVGLAMIIMGGH